MDRVIPLVGVAFLAAMWLVFPVRADVSSASIGNITEAAAETNGRKLATCCVTDETVSKPRLTVWTSARCAPCLRFWNDLAHNRDFRDAILSRFHVQWIDFDLHAAAATQRGIVSAPTFEAGDHQIRGYLGPEWLWRQCLLLERKNKATPATTDDAEPQIDGDALAPMLPPLPPLARPKQPAGSEIPASDESEPLESPFSEPRSVDHVGPAEPYKNSPTRVSQTDGWTNWLRSSVPIVLTGLEIAGLLSGTAATGGIGTIGIALLWRVWRRRGTRSCAPAEQSCPSNSNALREQEAERPTIRAPFPRQLDEARELLAIRQSEGRVATLDALRGMFLDDELNKLTASGDTMEVSIAEKLKAAIDTRVDEVAPLSTRIG